MSQMGQLWPKWGTLQSVLDHSKMLMVLGHQRGLHHRYERRAA